MSSSCHGPLVCVPTYPWACHALGRCLPGTHLPPSPKVPSSVRYKEEACQVLEARSQFQTSYSLGHVRITYYSLLQILLMIANPRSTLNLIDFTNDLKKVSSYSNNVAAYMELVLCCVRTDSFNQHCAETLPPYFTVQVTCNVTDKVCL